MNALESVLITKACHAAGVFRKLVDCKEVSRGVILQNHFIDLEKAHKIRKHDEENKNRLKSFAENLIHSNKHDAERVFPMPMRIKATAELTPAQSNRLNGPNVIRSNKKLTYCVAYAPKGASQHKTPPFVRVP